MIDKLDKKLETACKGMRYAACQIGNRNFLTQVFRLRTDSAAHPQMQQLMWMLYNQVSVKLPVIFPPKYIAEVL